jgi:hypothetical protein
MEPIAPSASTMALRPAAAQPSEVAAILRGGRVVVAEVLSSGDGTVLLAVGRQRVPAETALQLDPGQELLLRVEETSQGIVLGILDDDSADGSDLLRALRAVVGEDEPLGTLFARLSAELALARGEEASVLERLAQALARNAFPPGETADGLFALFQRAPLRFEGLLAAAVLAPHAAALLQGLRANLKAELLAVLERLEKGPLRAAVERLLAAVEAEQLLNVAREKAGEPVSWSLPVRDGEGWTTARLTYHRRRPREDGRERGARDGDTLVLGVRFSRLGPVRVELSLERERLLARIEVARADLVERIQADFATLSQSLRRDERAVQLFVRVRAPDEIEVEPDRLDIRFLHEHRLMDVSG